MEENLPVPGFINNLKYLPAHRDWAGSFNWLSQFVRDNALQLQKAKVIGGLVTTILGGIWLFNQDTDADENDDDEEYNDGDED